MTTLEYWIVGFEIGIGFICAVLMYKLLELKWKMKKEEK